MSEFLLEIFSEEIPAAFQTLAQAQLANTLTLKLKKEELPFESIKTFGTPRRLGIVITGLPSIQADRFEEKKGPQITAPAAAIEGFLKSTNTKRSDCEERCVDGKGPFLFATLHKRGTPTKEILGAALKETIGSFQWPKSMRWKSNDFSWARPLHGILALLDEQIIPLHIDVLNITSSAHTFGHRFLSPHLIEVKNYADYKIKLAKHYVQIDPLERQASIQEQSKPLLKEKELQLAADTSLLQETANLVEWPVVLRGTIDKKFMDLPEEILITSMRVHQRYFATRDKNDKLAPYFLIVSNMETVDQGAHIIEGNERVLRARLSDAYFFWKQDMKRPLIEWNKPLENRIFQEKLGTLAQKIERLQKTSKRLQTFLPSISSKDAEQAISLMKADLSTSMVGEFPELQGIMGGHYAKAQGVNGDIVLAIQEQYAPEGPYDTCPKEPLSVHIALTDKLDTLVGFFGIGLIPTSSKDPYALRRTALGIIRLLHENEWTVSVDDLIEAALEAHSFEKDQKEKTATLVKDFIKDRLTIYLKPLYSASLLNAVIDKAWNGSITQLNSKLAALKSFFDSPEGPDFINVYKRAANALKKEKTLKKGLNDTLFTSEEQNLFTAFKTTEATLQSLFSESFPDYTQMIKALASLKEPLELFFENVRIQDPDENLKANRLSLLSQIKESCLLLCDMSKL
jgi:glycyl-tRNA synthetase beta chain